MIDKVSACAPPSDAVSCLILPHSDDAVMRRDVR